MKMQIMKFVSIYDKSSPHTIFHIAALNKNFFEHVENEIYMGKFHDSRDIVRKVVGVGLVGFTNFTGLDFKTTQQKLDGTDYSVVEEEILNTIPLFVLNEIFLSILKFSSQVTIKSKELDKTIRVMEKQLEKDYARNKP